LRLSSPSWNIDRVTASLHAEHPDIGRDAAIDVASRKSAGRASADCRNRRRKRSCADGRLAHPLLVRSEHLVGLLRDDRFQV